MYTILLVVILFVLFVYFAHKSLITIRTRMEKSLSEISTHLKTRFDSMAALFKQLETQFDEKSEVFQTVSRERIGFEQLAKRYETNKSSPAGIVKTDIALEKLFREMRRSFKQHPELKAMELVNTTMTENMSIKTQLADLRQQYTKRLNAFTDGLKSFPNTVYAPLIGLNANAFEAYPAESEEPNP